MRGLVKDNPFEEFEIKTSWVGVEKARAAKAFLDGYGTRCRVKSFVIGATRKQYEEDVNVFQSGVVWEEIK